ncbi:helix-turn-helix domain-containing protein [Algoriphagus winogradskyi]|uniref:HTH-type transcriptional regulator / antitoxin HigA n=1 Tax=Algoriphagus winogradskyi TaxID=237017 RepID=A0ABY1NMG4_9BACT|nr:transcriptional regulator [Algoriphagus winogradskyi]SMP13192.1 HTH-type transcriptional regulator / antitoxin HigA [Algoriphagus winogradskyi]
MIKIIQNEAMYQNYLARIDEIFDAEQGTQKGDKLELLVTLVKLYEQENFQLPSLDPIEAIKIRLEDLGLKNKDLEPIMGDPGNISKILKGKRSLTVDMIRGLSEKLDFPVDILVGKSSKAVV